MARKAYFRGGVAALSLALAGYGLFAMAAPQSSGASRAAQAETPSDTVRQFFAWYLTELKAGREPTSDNARMTAFFTDEKLAEVQSSSLPDFDTVLYLPEPRSDWYDMKVTIGKPAFYHQQGMRDAYVDVTYSGFAGRPRDAVDIYTIGLNKTASGWKIDSVGVKD